MLCLAYIYATYVNIFMAPFYIRQFYPAYRGTSLRDRMNFACFHWVIGPKNRAIRLCPYDYKSIIETATIKSSHAEQNKIVYKFW